MIHGSSLRLLQSIAASFGVWGYRNRFLRSIMNVVTKILAPQSQKTSAEIPFELTNAERMDFTFQRTPMAVVR